MSRNTTRRLRTWIAVAGLVAPVAALISAAQANAVTCPPNPLPTVSIGNASVAEGNSTSSFNYLDFLITLSAANPCTSVTVTANTADGTATTVDNDYIAQTGVIVSIPPGSTTGHLLVPVVGDTTVESDQTLTVTISAATGATLLAPTVGTGTIVNDDGTTPPVPDVNAACANLTPPAGYQAVYGSSHSDRLDGGSGKQIIYGMGGNDRIEGGSGDDILCGGDGRDFIEGGSGEDQISGGNNHDTIDGGGGHDTIVGVTNGSDTVFQSSGEDTVTP